MMKMFGESGQFLEQGFKNIAEASGSDVEQQLSELKNIRAALNIAGTFANKAKDTVGYSKGMFNSVTKMVENMKSTPIDYVEGQNWGSKLSTLVRASDKVDSLKAAPLSQQTFTSLQAIGKQIQYFNSLGGQDKVSLLTNPTLLRQFLGTPEKAVQTLQSTSTALQEKINQVRGVGGK
jgi:hypothetical protein